MEAHIEIERLRTENERLTRSLAVAQAELTHYRRQDELLSLQRDHRVACDPAEELRDAAGMTDEQWTRHKERLTTRYKRAA